MPCKSMDSIQKHRVYSRDANRNLRQQTLEKLGSVCVICGFSDYRALQIDHIDGGGSQDRKNIGNRNLFLREVLKDNNNKYQLLCANCNWIKRFEQNEHGKRII